MTISTATTLNAIAFKTGYSDSTISSGLYTISTPPPQVAAPGFSPAAGTYSSAQSVTITSATGGASIAYTTDGSTPTESGGTVTHGKLYSGAISISATATLNAIAFKTGDTDSTVTSARYTIGAPPAAAPVFSPAVGTPHAVAITSATNGASIRYTTDGSTPTETHGTLYSVPVSISAPTTLSAIAYESGFADSPVTSVTIEIPTITITTPANGSTVP